MFEGGRPNYSHVPRRQTPERIYYMDWGSRQPVVFSHGWPLSVDAWEAQMLFLACQGYRCIAHDRRVLARVAQAVDRE